MASPTIKNLGRGKQSKKAQTLFYFTSKDFALQSLRDQRIKIARFNELNDPFDFLGISLNKKTERIRLKPLKDSMDATTGIICMSKTWHEPLLWGHYADKHKGICLEFRCFAEDWEEIVYRAERPSLKTFGCERVRDLTEADRHRLSKMKFNAWSYEKEYRKFIQLKEPDLVTGFYFHPFSDRMKLARVILGSRCDVTKKTIRNLCRHVGENVGLIKSRPAHLSFRVIQDVSYKGGLPLKGK